MTKNLDLGEAKFTDSLVCNCGSGVIDTALLSLGGRCRGLRTAGMGKRSGVPGSEGCGVGDWKRRCCIAEVWVSRPEHSVGSTEPLNLLGSLPFSLITTSKSSIRSPSQPSLSFTTPARLSNSSFLSFLRRNAVLKVSRRSPMDSCRSCCLCVSCHSLLFTSFIESA